MNGKEFIRKIKRYGKKHSIKVRLVKRRGKGSHETLYVEKHFTIIRCTKDELKTGTLKAMLKQLNLNEKEI